MALVPFPPTSATFLVLCAKSEAFTGNPSAVPPVPGIPTSTIDAKLRAEGDRAVRVALSDRIPPGSVVTMVDEGFQDIVIATTARLLLGQRGWQPKGSSDDEIIGIAKRADADLDAMGPGAPGGEGKRQTPDYVLANITPPVVDGVMVNGHATSDWSARSRSDPLRTRPWTP